MPPTTPSADARLFAHWAAQIPAAAGTTLAPARDDFRHTALTWDADERALVSLPVLDGRQAGLCVRTGELFVRRGGARSATRGVEGSTLDAALEWLGRELGSELQRPDHDLPPYAVEGGAPFPAAPADLTAVDDWLAFAAPLLEDVAKDPRASGLVLWPHHFDLATLLSLEDEPGEEAPSVGVGLSLGDGAYEEPYFYVSPWPYPAPAALGALSRGRWNTDGFTAAVLTAQDLSGVAAEAEARRFVQEEVSLSVTALAGA